MKVGDIVQIQDENEWKGLYGVVEYVTVGISHIFCVKNPCYLYVATKNNNIKVIEESKKDKYRKNVNMKN
ncbi:hypothetical protein Ccar_15295 [Clostridium carboxidivorans P7]|uniref:DUF2187 domain-containing protein n=1 Tax=Clostridium carboxidivorans P7 TaxID=536227 RepID=C6Q0U7_9CLOT|nr:hypothetical protein [Clostridium carboxidivorans]AKN32151.1 hypothetical protein Ccar_15295 [Clostridium carboxidivorans P7]EET84879.1 hypothetical protein CcarbDRAFT_4664 [Clostridium carboxidivorans P7]